MSNKDCKFGQVYFGQKDTSEVQFPSIYSRNTRAVQSAYDSAYDQKVEAQGKIQELLLSTAPSKGNPGQVVNVQAVLNQVEIIENSTRTMETLEGIYLDWFGAEIPNKVTTTVGE